MKRRKSSHKQILDSCAEMGQDDGVDPRTFFKDLPAKKTNRKVLQLCREVERTVGWILAYESGDDLLSGLVIESVEPAPDSTRLAVTVLTEAPIDAPARGVILERLQRFKGQLRSEVAKAVCRKRVPDLVFRVNERVEGGQ
jgi:ribosome-binding factor A